jgi:uncharacterized membrane protein
VSDGDDDMGSEDKITAMAHVMMLVKEAVRGGAAVVVVVAAMVWGSGCCSQLLAPRRAREQRAFPVAMATFRHQERRTAAHT